MTQFDNSASTVAKLPTEEVSGDIKLALTSIVSHSIYYFEDMSDSVSVNCWAKVINGPNFLIGKEFRVELICNNNRTGNDDIRKRPHFVSFGPYEESYGGHVYLYLLEFELHYIGNLIAADLFDDNVIIDISILPKEKELKPSWALFFRNKVKHSKFQRIDHFSIDRVKSGNG